MLFKKKVISTFKGDVYKKYQISSPFGVNRGKYYHSGNDYVGTKKENVVTLLDGLMTTYEHVAFGNVCSIGTNLKYYGGVDDILNHSYAHMGKIKKHQTKIFCLAGTVVGKFGNTGQCYTFDNGGWRTITERERNDPQSTRGVHLHLWFWQNCSPGKKTPLLKALKKAKLIEQRDYFWQWGKIIYNPKTIYKYLWRLI